MSTKFATRCGARAIWKSKLLNIVGFGVELRKICTTLWRDIGLEVKIVKNWGFRSAFWSSAPQHLYTLWRETDSEVEIVKDWHARSMFWSWDKLSSAKFAPRCGARAIGSQKSLKINGLEGTFRGSKCFSRGRRRDFDSLQNTRQAQEFVRVAKTLAGARRGGLEEGSDAESVEGLQISCHGSVT